MRIRKTIKQCSYEVQMRYVSERDPWKRRALLEAIREYEAFLRNFAKSLPDRFKEDVATKIQEWRSP